MRRICSTNNVAQNMSYNEHDMYLFSSFHDKRTIINNEKYQSISRGTVFMYCIKWNSSNCQQTHYDRCKLYVKVKFIFLFLNWLCNEYGLSYMTLKNCFISN